MFDEPETAIASFERIHGLRVAVHDLSGTLWGVVGEERYRHSHPLCTAVKARDDGAYCFELETTQLRQDLSAKPSGRMHICHAGLVEWVVPVFNATKLAWVLFAGPRIPGTSLQTAYRMGRWLGGDKPWTKIAVLPPSVEKPEADDILEHLRQLAARLRVWAEEVYGNANRSLSAPSGDDATVRATLIRRFIVSSHREAVTLSALAERLGLSESRTSHLVRETCGASFQDLLVEARTKTAIGLLRTSPLSMVQVAQYSGFRDIAHFHRVIKRVTGMSPGQYRRKVES